jgi:hypothetical protein
MSPSRESAFDDQYFARYLLGLLPAEATNRMDEMSVVDTAIALRLRVVEDDLVDAYVRGTLDTEALGHIEAFYLSSEYRRRKVRFARSLLRLVNRMAAQ